MTPAVSDEIVDATLKALLDADAKTQQELIALGGLCSHDDLTEALVHRTMSTMIELGLAERDDAGGVTMTPFGRAFSAHPRVLAARGGAASVSMVGSA